MLDDSKKKQAVSADVTLIKLRQRNTVKRKLHNSFVSTSLRSDDDNAFKRTRSFTKPNKHGIRTMPSGLDSSRDLFIPAFLRSLNFWKGHVFTIQKKVTDFWSINVYKMGAKHDRPIDMVRKYMGFIVFSLHRSGVMGPYLQLIVGPTLLDVSWIQSWLTTMLNGLYWGHNMFVLWQHQNLAPALKLVPSVPSPRTFSCCWLLTPFF